MDETKDLRIRESFARQGLMQTLGCRINHIEEGRVVLELPITSEVSQQHGVAHAGASFALGDSASGYAALSVMEANAEVMTVEMKINLIAPAAGKRLLATGEVVKAGRRLVITRCTVQAEADDGSLRDVALLQGTMIPV
ncbi:phenylacetic acid degradation protein [Jannaschia sp. EhC01]|nr:phenylacetic acid degradation protein [Jannaschia sp. EhC01]